MFCRYCGSPLSDDAKFCPGCGKAIAAPEEETVTTETVAETETTTEETPSIYTEITDPWGNNDPVSEDEIPAEEQTKLFNAEESTEEITAEEAPKYDPFSGPAHPSVKKNIIITCVVVAIATLISIVFMVIGIVKFAESDLNNESASSWEEMEQEFNESFGSEGNGDEVLALGDYDEFSGNTNSNITNMGIAVSDLNGGVYYSDIEGIMYRSAANDVVTVVPDSVMDISGLNHRDNVLYYVKSDLESVSEVYSYDIYAETETLLTEFDEIIYYTALWENELYIVTELEIYAIDLDTVATRNVLKADSEIYDFHVCEEGIYYALWDGGTSELYLADHNGKNAESIATGYAFRFDNGKLYINDQNSFGRDTVEVADLDGKNREVIYTFDENDCYIDFMAVEDDMLYCSTFDDNDIYSVQVIDLSTGEKDLIDESRFSDENPFYCINVAGNWLIYLDDTFSYGVRVYDLTNL